MDWNFDEYCRNVSEELKAFLPDKVYDVHAHPGKKRDMDTVGVPILNELPEDCGVSSWDEFTSLHVGEKRLKVGLFFALPLFPQGVDIRRAMLDANDYIANEVKSFGGPSSRCSLLVSHLLKPEDVEQHLKNDLVAGFKPYISLNPGCSSNSRIQEFLPDWVLGLAHETEKVITLHIQKHEALNHPDNIRDIHDICSKYPKAKIILAHCGCSFNVYNTLKGAKHYIDLDNIYFDTSAVCEGMALMHMFKLFPSEKFMWGTDFPISARHGRFVGFGDFVYSLQSNTMAGGSLPQGLKALHHGLESLRALVYAIRECCLSDNEVEGLFYDNAVNIIGMD